MSNMDAVVSTIKNLRARAQDSASSETETMSALAQADRLMKKHQLTVSDLKDAVDKGGIVRVYWGKDTKVLHPCQYVATAVAQLTETRGWVHTQSNGNTQLCFTGFEADTEYALYLVDLVHNTMETEWAKYRVESDYANAPKKTKSRIRPDFMRGMAMRIRERMIQMAHEKFSADAADPAQTGTQLVVAKRAMISAEMESLGVNLRKRRKTTVKVGVEAFASGNRAGGKANITTGIEDKR